MKHHFLCVSLKNFLFKSFASQTDELILVASGRVLRHTVCETLKSLSKAVSDIQYFTNFHLIEIFSIIYIWHHLWKSQKKSIKSINCLRGSIFYQQIYLAETFWQYTFGGNILPTYISIYICQKMFANVYLAEIFLAKIH